MAAFSGHTGAAVPRNDLLRVDDVLPEALVEQADDVIDHGRNLSREVERSPEVVERFQPKAVSGLQHFRQGDLKSSDVTKE